MSFENIFGVLCLSAESAFHFNRTSSINFNHKKHMTNPFNGKNQSANYSHMKFNRRFSIVLKKIVLSRIKNATDIKMHSDAHLEPTCPLTSRNPTLHNTKLTWAICHCRNPSLSTFFIVRNRSRRFDTLVMVIDGGRPLHICKEHLQAVIASTADARSDVPRRMLENFKY